MCLTKLQEGVIRMKRRGLCFLTIMLIFAFLYIPAFAEDGVIISPMYNNTSRTNTAFAINSSGNATVTVGYFGFSGITTHAKITTYIERKLLGLFWVRVDIGTTNNQWIDNPVGHQFITSHSTQLSQTGHYRAVVLYTIYGSGGAADEILL